jgi:hypothetical protein
VTRGDQWWWWWWWSVKDEQEDAAEDEAVVLEDEDLSDEEADSAGPVKWVVPPWEALAADRGGWRAVVEGTGSERK